MLGSQLLDIFKEIESVLLYSDSFFREEISLKMKSNSSHWGWGATS